jgi:GNAT superfamily N-acetyltransferase
MTANAVFPLSPVEKIRFDHDTEPFDCGHLELNRFLQRYAIVNQRAGTAQTYVVCRGNTVVGYYSLAAGSMAHRDVPERVGQGLARHRVPLMILARLAVDVHEQGSGLGAALLKDALLRTLQAADILGIRAIFVHAKDDNAKCFYERFDFKPSPTDPHHLYCLVKDIKRLIGS